MTRCIGVLLLAALVGLVGLSGCSEPVGITVLASNASADAVELSVVVQRGGAVVFDRGSWLAPGAVSVSLGSFGGPEGHYQWTVGDGRETVDVYERFSINSGPMTILVAADGSLQARVHVA
jgi:hypothetical protein